MSQQQINEHHAEWNRLILLFRDAETTAAQKENAYRRERAKFIIRAKDADPKLSQAAAETLADADDRVMGLRLERMGAEAESKGLKEKLFWCRSKADALRSQMVDEREADRLCRDHPVGA